MVKNVKDVNFQQLKVVAFDRLHPGSLFIFLWVLLLISGVIFIFTMFGSQSYHVTSPIWKNIIEVNKVILIVQFVITILFSIPKISYKFQKIQMIITSIALLKMSWEFYIAFFLIRADSDLPETFDRWGIFAFIAGIIILFYSCIRAIRRVRQGHFKVDGKGLYDFQQSKGTISLPFIFGATILGGVFGKIEFSTITGMYFELLFFLAIAMIIQYLIAMVWPEFLLITYCKFRFPSFIVPEEPQRKKQTNLIERIRNWNLYFWFKNPFTVLKSRAGLVEERAPFIALIIVWLQGSVLIFLIMWLLALRKLLTEAVEVELIEDITAFFIASSFFSFVIVLFIRIIFTVIKKVKEIKL